MNTLTTIANLSETLSSVTAGQLEIVKKVIKGESLDSLASKFVKTENKSIGLIGAYHAVFKGVAQTLCHGNVTALKGLTVASRRQSGAFRAMVQHGIVNESGAILIGKDPESKKSSESELLAQSMAFCALLWASREAQREAESAARKAASEKAVAEKAAAEVEAADAPQNAINIVCGLLELGALTPEQVSRIVTSLRENGHIPTPRKAKTPA